MPKIKLTKNELKAQKDELKRFSHFLPMLVLKKQQLQAEINKIYRAIEEVSGEIEKLRKDVSVWVDVFAQDVELTKYLKIKQIKTVTGNIAGTDIPIFEEVIFEEHSYDYFLMPLWVDKGIEVLRQEIILKAKIIIYHRQMDIVKEELRITTQRVNLFEKIKIPDARENIRVINIFLGDLQTASVVRGKIAKSKLERKVYNEEVAYQ